MDTVNDKIHDDLISHDIRLRRVAGDTQKQIDGRLDQLGVDLKMLATKIDPFGASRSDARERRIARLEKESTELINEAYREINRAQADELRRIAGIETEATVQAIGNALP
jgi:hypothetical protein